MISSSSPSSSVVRYHVDSSFFHLVDFWFPVSAGPSASLLFLNLAVPEGEEYSMLAIHQAGVKSCESSISSSRSFSIRMIVSALSGCCEGSTGSPLRVARFHDFLCASDSSGPVTIIAMRESRDERDFVVWCSSLFSLISYGFPSLTPAFFRSAANTAALEDFLAPAMKNSPVQQNASFDDDQRSSIDSLCFSFSSPDFSYLRLASPSERAALRCFSSIFLVAFPSSSLLFLRVSCLFFVFSFSPSFFASPGWAAGVEEISEEIRKFLTNNKILIKQEQGEKTHKRHPINKESHAFEPSGASAFSSVSCRLRSSWAPRGPSACRQGFFLEENSSTPAFFTLND